MRNNVTKPVYSIVLAPRDGLKFTVNCVSSLLRTVPEEAEIIPIDRASTDGTRSYLKEMSERSSCIRAPVFLEQDTGWCPAVNVGLQKAVGTYLVVLNTDVMTGSGWLQGLRECLDSTPQSLPDIQKVGIVGPMTNSARNFRQTINAQYYPDELDHFVQQFKRRYARNWIPSLYLSGFCMMIHRDCWDDIGGFDDSRPLNGFHENDLSLRAHEFGWHSVIAGDVFVHRDRPPDPPGIFPGPLPGLNGGSAFSEKWRAKRAGAKRLVAAYRIKNCAETLLQSLDAASGFADDIVILDDGSTDKTTDICKTHPAVSRYERQELPFDERRDRNRTLEMAAEYDPDWVISIDGDEVYELDQKRADRLMHLNDPHIKALGFFWYTFWEPSLTYFRADGAFGQTNGYRMYKWEPGQSIVMGTPEGLHCGNIPQFPEGSHRFTNVRVRHLSYETEEKRYKKYYFYRETDKNPQEHLVGSKDYSHLISPTFTLRKYEQEYGLSLCLITKDEANGLESFLSFFEPYVNEICLVDTGSSDDTLNIARLFTDKIETFHSEGLELDQARNLSLSMAGQPWILCMDPDERIDFWDMPLLQRMTDDIEPHAYSFEVLNHQKDGPPIMTIALRLFRNDKRIYYTHPVHETVQKGVQAIPDVVIKPSAFPIHHYGYLKEDAEIQKKLELYLECNKKYRESHPEDPLPWYNEALHYINEGNIQNAVDFLHKALELDPEFTAPYGQLALVNQETAISLWRSLLEVMPGGHPGRAQAEQTLDKLVSLTPARQYVGDARTQPHVFSKR